MPKETIVSGKDGARLYVGWRKDSDVQLGVERQPNVTTVTYGPSGGSGMITTHGGSSTAPYTGVWTDTLTRVQINDLIRALRKARDQAYGKDE